MKSHINTMNPRAISKRLCLFSAASFVFSAAPGWTMEKLTAITGNQVSNLTNAASYFADPGSTVIAESVLPSNTGDNYGTRIRGYVTTPATDLYTFWESGDESVNLFLSPDETLQISKSLLPALT